LQLSISPQSSVAPAEAALQELAGEFDAWMHAECERLEAGKCGAKA
jgi:hypothetical protein